MWTCYYKAISNINNVTDLLSWALTIVILFSNYTNWVLSYCQKKNTRSLEEIYEYLYPQSNLHKADLLSKLQMTLKKLEEKQAVIFVNGFTSISLVEPKLAELVDVSKSNQI